MATTTEANLVSDRILRKEIMTFQKAKADMLRWKLLAIGGVAAAPLGLLGPSQVGDRWIVFLGVAPFVAAYCDALARTYDLRIALIAKFFKSHRSSVVSEYEKFLDSAPVARMNWWHLTRAAGGVWSSVVTCLLVSGMGVWIIGSTRNAGLVILAAGLVGVLVVYLVERWYRAKRDEIYRDPPESSIG
jgi:hypothetical protein